MMNTLFDSSGLISAIISLFAFVVSCIALYQTRKQHLDSYRAKLVFNIIQQNQKLYLTVQNIGQTSAFDIDITFSYDIKCPIKNLCLIPPNVVFRYNLLESTQISAFPELQTLQINVKYKDIYRTTSSWEETNEFPILELLKYTCNWNETQNCYDIYRI